MAVQAGCGFKPPTTVFAVPLPVNGAPARRLDVASSPPRDAGSDVIMAGRRSGQWVTLSKALLLQLVERICQLSFQTDVTSNSASSSRLCRKSADEFEPEMETESFWRRSLLPECGGSPSEHASERGSRQDVTEDCALAVENQLTPHQDDSGAAIHDHDQITSGSGETPADVHSLAVSCCDVDENSAVELDVVEVNVEKTPTECSGTLEDVVGGPASDVGTSDRKHLDVCYRHHQYHHRRRHQRTVCRRRLQLRTRRCRKAALATSSGGCGGQVRCQVAARRGDDDSRAAAVGRRVHLRGVRRCRQSWMALSKDIVYGAVENELRQVDASCRSEVAASPAKSTVIWNPATCLSPSEKRRFRLSCAPPPALPDFRYRDVMFREPESDVVGRSCNAASVQSSSMLSELLGFGSATPTAVLPAEVALTRHRRCSYNGNETTFCDVIAPSAGPGSGIEAYSHAKPLSESDLSYDDITTALNYCVRPDTVNPEEDVATSSAVPRIWRPVGSYPVQSTSRPVTRPRWVAVNKGDVCSLVDNLVSTMIASEARGTEKSGSGDVRDASTLVDPPPPPPPPPSSSRDKPALPLTARCSVAASEPRKWKSDLLQRMRNEDT